MDGTLDEIGAIMQHPQRGIARRLAGERRQARPHRLGHLHGVSARLAFHRQHDGRPQTLIVSGIVEEGGELLVLLDTVLGLAHVGEMHRRAVAIGDHQAVIGGGVMQLAGGLHRITLRAAAEHAGG